MHNTILDRLPEQHFTPAQTWDIGPGQRFTFSTAGLRKRPIPAVVVSGSLIFDRELLLSTLDLTARLDDATVTFSARMIGLLSTDPCETSGTVTIADDVCPITLLVRSNGVYVQRGRTPSLWLSIGATIDAPPLRSALRRRGGSRFAVCADLNLNPRNGAQMP